MPNIKNELDLEKLFNEVVSCAEDTCEEEAAWMIKCPHACGHLLLACAGHFEGLIDYLKDLNAEDEDWHCVKCTKEYGFAELREASISL